MVKASADVLDVLQTRICQKARKLRRFGKVRFILVWHRSRIKRNYILTNPTDIIIYNKKINKKDNEKNKYILFSIVGENVIENYEEYEKLMNRYENLRKLTRDDFDSYFAEIIISKNDSTKLRYRRVTYDYGNYEGDPFLNINIIKEKVDDTENLKGQALVLIMTRRCLDYNVRPLIVE